MIKIKLIEDWRKAWKMVSVQAMAVAALLLQFADLWQQLPPEVVAMIPQAYVMTIAKYVILGGLVGRLIQQFAPKEENAKN